MDESEVHDGNGRARPFMRNNIQQEIVVIDNASILEAMKKIDNNLLRIIFIMDKNKKIVGLATDGDIRRQLISGAKLEDKISFNKNFYSIDHKDNFNKLCLVFRESDGDVIPILKDGALFNYITKHQFNVMLIEGKEFSTDRDFTIFNSFSLEKEIYNRPWGFYKSVWLNSNSQAKIICVNPDSELSLQKHYRREEHWIVLKGSGFVIIENDKIDLHPGKYIFIPKESKHQLVNNTKSQLFISEVQLGDYFGEDDIKRYSDKYGRVDYKGK